MENIARALILVFGMLMFAVGFAYSMYLINGVTTASNTLLQGISTTKYYDNIEVNSDLTTRNVGVDTIIPTLYRYYKENFAVKILKNDGDIIQLFDVNIESKIAKADAYTGTTDVELLSLKNSIYNDSNNSAYLFKAPWSGNTTENTRTRIDYFLNGTKGYINNVFVDYEKNIGTGGFLGKYG